MSTAELLTRARRETQLTQSELAIRARTSRPTLSAYERGRTSPTVENAARLLAAAGQELAAVPQIDFVERALSRGRTTLVPTSLPALSMYERSLLVQIRHSMYPWYMSGTVTVTVSEARRELASIIDRVRDEHAPIYLARRGRRVAAVIDADDLDQILELAEDMADIRAAEAARAEMKATGEAPIPWEQVKADLGLT
jgi:prevent-host-death family protein